MKAGLIIFLLLAGMAVLGGVACRKDRSCEGCARDGNQPPRAVAGADGVAVLPRDSVLLDGSASSDPDGVVVAYQWRSVGGPASALAQPFAAKTIARSLAEGVHFFELTVTDDKGAQGRDTVQVRVQRDNGTNLPPVARAGADTTLTLPVNTTTLDGRTSFDPDGTIAAYRWSKIEGPSSFGIDNPAAALTGVGNLFPGVYRFELTVTDNGGLTAKDTVAVTVQADPATNTGACNPRNRPLVQARLVAVGQLSQARNDLAVAAAGGKLLFAGGWVGTPATKSRRVDILTIASGSWRTAELSVPGSGMATAVVGNKILVAGGTVGNTGSTFVDMYDAATNRWTTAGLSAGRFSMVGAAAGGKALFAGGLQYLSVYRNQVDIWDERTGSWSATTLTDRTGTGTVGIATAVLGDKIYLAGEASDWYSRGGGSYSSTINIYDATTGNWSLAALRQPRGYGAGIGVSDKLYWAGGVVRHGPEPFTDEVEIMNPATGTSTFGCLFQPNAFLTAVAKGSFIVFFTGQGREKNKFDIYDTATNTWSVGVLPFAVEGASIVSANNALYVAGGKVNGVLSAGVWRLEF
ncbi:MAG TPA: hypothetical protein VGE66_16085 [Chitinophagaceae bacterium]